VVWIFYFSSIISAHTTQLWEKGRIRIRTSDCWIRIREAQKHADPADDSVDKTLSHSELFCGKIQLRHRTARKRKREVSDKNNAQVDTVQCFFMGGKKTGILFGYHRYFWKASYLWFYFIKTFFYDLFIMFLLFYFAVTSSSHPAVLPSPSLNISTTGLVPELPQVPVAALLKTLHYAFFSKSDGLILIWIRKNFLWTR
jgi:hypothetical protein